MRLVSTKRRRLIVGGLVVVLIPVLALAWWLGSPLFISKTVDEEFPLTVGADIPEGMSRSEAENHHGRHGHDGQPHDGIHDA